MYTTLDLKLFDLGEGAATEGAAQDTTGAKAGKDATKAVLAKTVYGKSASEAGSPTEGAGEGSHAAGAGASNPAVGASAATAKPTFDELIRGEYKADYDARVKANIDRRFKAQEQVAVRQKALEPVLDMVASRYGVDPTDADALRRAIEQDDAMYADEAEEKGIPVEQLKQFKRLERENASLQRAMEASERQQNAERIYAGWMEQAESAKAVYPTMDFDAETQSEDFTKLLRAGVDVRTAYEVVHKDDIIHGAMQFTAQKVAQKVASDVAARGKRPQENGASAQSASVIRKASVGELTDADVIEIAERAKRGVRTTF